MYVSQSSLAPWYVQERTIIIPKSHIRIKNRTAEKTQLYIKPLDGRQQHIPPPPPFPFLFDNAPAPRTETTDNLNELRTRREMKGSKKVFSNDKYISCLSMSSKLLNCIHSVTKSNSG